MKTVGMLINQWPILTLIVVSLVLRLWRLDELVTIGGDQGYDLIKIKEILEGNLTLLGPPIGRFADTVVYLGPLYYYLTAPFVAIFNLDPIGLAIPTIIGRLAATIFIYFVAKKLFNQQVGIVAAIISALSPYFTKSLGPSSPPYLIPLVAILIIFTLTSNQRSKGGHQFLIQFGLAGFLSGVTTNLHYLGLCLFLALILYLFLTSRIPSSLTRRMQRREKHTFEPERRIPRTLALGSLFYGVKRNRLGAAISLIFGFFLAISPTVLFELRNDFFLTKQLIFQLSSGVISPQSQSIASQFIYSFNFLTEGTIGFSPPFSISIFLLMAAILVTAKTQIISKAPMLFMLSIVVINLVLASLYGQKVQSHYLAASYVPLFIFSAVLISETLRFSRWLPPILIVVVSILLILQNDLSRSSGYTMPEDLTLVQIRQIAKIIADDVGGGQSFNITSTLDGDSRALPYRYLVDVYGKQPLDVQTYDKGDSLYVITRDPTSSVRQNSLFEIASFQPSSVSKSWNISGDIKLIKLSKKETEKPQSAKFITIVNPVRPRNLWNNQSINVITYQLKQINDRDLKATWLLAYENLFDVEITSLFKNQDHEIGAFLEVSEKWATDSHVVYKIAEGDYYRPDKVFLSGYSSQDRKKLIKTYFEKFEESFGYTPKSAGAWYIDANSQELLSELGVTSALTVSDQFNTDAASIWGKYWGMPFYPSKFNTLEPARSQSEKLSVVNIQWAQRDLVAGYGQEIKDSRQSFQANDYINNGYDTNYFTALMENYLTNAQNNDFMQITIGLEAAQEAQRFADEFARELDIVKGKQKSESVNVVTLADFANWYMGKYPGISPSHLLKDGDDFWYMSPKFRAAVFKDINYQIKDLRYYEGSIFEDYYLQDLEPYLKRNVPEIVGFVGNSTQINLGTADKLELLENFDRLTLKLDNRLVQINTKGVMIDGNYITVRQDKNYRKGHQKRMFLVKTKEVITNSLNIFKYSSINGQKILGLSPDGSTILGFKDFIPGVYMYDFQTAARFLSPAKIIENWQP